jgi:exodeoxyribonuclease VII small subunit
MRFEDALKRLEEIIALLEEGNVLLDESLKLYEEGQGLIKFCRDKLNKVESKVKELVQTREGEFELKDINKEA